MSGRERHCRIRPKAWRKWEDLDLGPCTLPELIAAMERIPERDLMVTRVLRPPGVIHIVRGSAFGREVQLSGIRTADGKWVEVWNVGTVGTGEGGVE